MMYFNRTAELRSDTLCKILISPIFLSARIILLSIYQYSQIIFFRVKYNKLVNNAKLYFKILFLIHLQSIILTKFLIGSFL